MSEMQADYGSGVRKRGLKMLCCWLWMQKGGQVKERGALEPQEARKQIFLWASRRSTNPRD